MFHCMYDHIFIQSSIDGHLACVHTSALVGNDALNMGAHMSFQVSVSGS